MGKERPWVCPRCRHVGFPIPTRIGERLGTAIGGTIGAFIGYCAFDRFIRYPIPKVGNYRGLVSGLMAGASTGNQIGHILDTHLIRLYQCPHCRKLVIR